MSGRFSRTAGAAMAMTLGITSVGACGDATARTTTTATKKNLVLGFVNGGTTEFHNCLQRAVEAEAARRGVQVVSANSKQNPQAELSNMDSMIKRNVDAIIVQTVNSEALGNDIARARGGGIPVLTTSVVPAADDSILGAVVVDLNQVGLLDAGWMSNDAVGAAATTGIVAGAPGAASDVLVKGFTDNLPRNIRVVASAPGMYDRGKARAVAAQMIRQHPDLTYAFVVNEDMAVGVSEAFRAAGKHVKIATVNGTDTGLAAIRDGRFQATVANPASKLGQQAVENTLSLLNREPITKIDYVPISLITKPDLERAPDYCLTE